MSSRIATELYIASIMGFAFYHGGLGWAVLAGAVAGIVAGLALGILEGPECDAGTC